MTRWMDNNCRPEVSLHAWSRMDRKELNDQDFPLPVLQQAAQPKHDQAVVLCSFVHNTRAQGFGALAILQLPFLWFLQFDPSSRTIKLKNNLSIYYWNYCKLSTIAAFDLLLYLNKDKQL